MITLTKHMKTGMEMFRRIGAAIVATALIAGVVYLGWRSDNDRHYIWWFGLSAALAAPIGLGLFGFALNGSDSAVLKELARVPEIGRLVDEAKTQQEKIRLLEAERRNLADLVRLESRRQAIIDRVTSLENDAERIFVELENLEQEQEALGINVGNSNVSAEIAKLRDRVEARKRGDVLIRLGSRIYQVDPRIVRILPFGTLLLSGLVLMNKLDRAIAKARRPTHEPV